MYTFASVVLKKAGTQSITASDAVNGLNAIQSSINVTHAQPSHLSVSGPSKVTSKLPFNLTVTVRDAYENVVKNYTGAISFGSSDGTASLPANYTFTLSDQGVRTFTATLKAIGVHTITATDTTTGTINGQAEFTVERGTKVTLTIHPFPIPPPPPPAPAPSSDNGGGLVSHTAQVSAESAQAVELAKWDDPIAGPLPSTKSLRRTQNEGTEILSLFSSDELETDREEANISI